MSGTKPQQITLPKPELRPLDLEALFASTDTEPLELAQPGIDYSEPIASSWIVAPEHTLTQRLYERRLSAEVIATFEIEPHANGWQYPAAGGVRWKNANSQAQPKYKWIGGKPASAEFYHAPDLIQSISNSSGALWIVSGEPDVWAMHSAGISHTMSGFTEASVSSSLRDVLYSLGVLIVYIAPDLDPTGQQWARKIATALNGSGIELDCRALPAALGSKADLGKAWQQYELRIPFERWLTGLTRFEPELIVTPKEARIEATGETLHNVPDDYRLAIIEKLGVLKFGSDGWSSLTIHKGKKGGKKYNVLCPFHNDTHPSASVHKEIGLKCFSGCGGRVYLWHEIGERLGLGSIADWYRTHADIAQTVAPELTCELREALVKAGKTSAARAIEALYSIGFMPGDTFEIAEAGKKLMDLVSAKTLRDVINSYKSADGSFSLFFPTLLTLQQSTIEKTVKNSAKRREGRPSKSLIMPSPSEIADNLGVRIGSHYAKMPAEALKDRKIYRAEVIAALPRRKPGQYARKMLGELIGVTARTAQGYDELNKLKVTQIFNRQLLTAEDIAELPEALSVLDKMRRRTWIENGELYTQEKYEREPSKSELKTIRSRIGKPRRFSAIREAAELALSCSPTRQIWLVTQEKNYYEAGSDYQASEPRPQIKSSQPLKPVMAAKTQRELDYEALCKHYAELYTPLTPEIEAMLKDWHEWNHGGTKPLEIAEVREIGEPLAFYRLNFGELNQSVIDLLWLNVKNIRGSIVEKALLNARERKGELKSPKAYIQKVIESEVKDYEARTEQELRGYKAERKAQRRSWLEAHGSCNKRNQAQGKPAHKSELAVNQWLKNRTIREARFEAEYNARELAEAGNG